MHRPETLLQRRWPASPEFATLARQWTTRISTEIVQLIWRGTDLLIQEIPQGISRGMELAQIERTLGYLLHNQIARIQDRTLPFVVVHEPYDFELLKTRQARPPQPDLGFVMNGCDRVVWPVEMKVLRDEADVIAYCGKVQENFLTCRYASFTGEGALLGYLLSGDPQVAFVNIAKSLLCALERGPTDPPRDHRVSEHVRTIPPGAHYAKELRCHHLLLLVCLNSGDADVSCSTAA